MSNFYTTDNPFFIPVLVLGLAVPVLIISSFTYLMYIYIPRIAYTSIYTHIWGSKKNANASINNTGFKNNKNKNK